MRRICLFCVALLYLMPCAAAQTSLKVEPEAQEKRKAVLTWSEALTSFSGSYVRTYISFSDRTPNPGVPQVQNITYRFEADKRYMSYYSDVMARRDFCSFIDGQYVQVFDMDTPPEADITSKHFVKYGDAWQPQWPRGMIYSPQMVLQQQDVFGRWSLKEYFSKGHTLLLKRDNKEILIHRRPHENRKSRAQITFDEENRVEEIVYARDWDSEDIAPYCDQDPLDLFHPIDGWRYSDYKNINGLWFPLHCESFGYSGGIAQDAIQERRNAGELTRYEAAVNIAQTVPFNIVLQIFVEYEESSLVVNEPLSDSMFHVTVPSDALELNQDGVLRVVAERDCKAPWWREHRVMLLASSLLLLIAVLALLSWWRYSH